MTLKMYCHSLTVPTMTLPQFILEFASLLFGKASHTTSEPLAIAHFIVGAICQCRQTGEKRKRKVSDIVKR